MPGATARNREAGNRLLGGFTQTEIFRHRPMGGHRKSVRDQAALEQLADSGSAARHPPRKAPVVDQFQLSRRQHDLKPLSPVHLAHDGLLHPSENLLTERTKRQSCSLLTLRYLTLGCMWAESPTSPS